MTLVLNGSETPIRRSWETWGDIVQGMDVDLGPLRQVLTSVRLDGVDQPSYRAEDLWARPVSSFSTIELQTGERSVLARQSLSDAAMALPELADACHAVADALRVVDVSEATRNLALLTQNLSMVFQIVAEASSSLEGLTAPSGPGLPLSDLTQALDTHVRELIEAQQASDWLRLSETLEYDVEPLLRKWRDLLVLVATA